MWFRPRLHSFVDKPTVCLLSIGFLVTLLRCTLMELGYSVEWIVLLSDILTTCSEVIFSENNCRVVCRHIPASVVPRTSPACTFASIKVCHNWVPNVFNFMTNLVHLDLTLPFPNLLFYGVMKFQEWFLPPYLVGVNGIPRCLVFSRGLGLGRGDPAIRPRLYSMPLSNHPSTADNAIYCCWKKSS